MKRLANCRRSRRGSAMAEFTIAGIAGVTLLISTFQLCIVMWNYHTMAYAVHETNRYISSHGRGCTMGGNACAITVGDIANKLKSNAVGVPDDTLIMTLKSESGTVVNCNPLKSCEGNTTQWPPVAHMDNNPPNHTKITARVSLKPAIIVLWFGSPAKAISSVTLPASSEIPMVF